MNRWALAPGLNSLAKSPNTRVGPSSKTGKFDRENTRTRGKKRGERKGVRYVQDTFYARPLVPIPFGWVRQTNGVLAPLGNEILSGCRIGRKWVATMAILENYRIRWASKFASTFQSGSIADQESAGKKKNLNHVRRSICYPVI